MAMECTDFGYGATELFSRVGISPPRGVLLYGPPGYRAPYLLPRCPHRATKMPVLAYPPSVQGAGTDVAYAATRTFGTSCTPSVVLTWGPVCTRCGKTMIGQALACESGAFFFLVPALPPAT
eukprot:202816-Rhodomonas_salina.2